MNDIANAWPIAKDLRDNNSVTIITVALLGIDSNLTSADQLKNISSGFNYTFAANVSQIANLSQSIGDAICGSKY